MLPPHAVNSARTVPGIQSVPKRTSYWMVPRVCRQAGFKTNFTQGHSYLHWTGWRKSPGGCPWIMATPKFSEEQAKCCVNSFSFFISVCLNHLLLISLPKLRLTAYSLGLGAEQRGLCFLATQQQVESPCPILRGWTPSPSCLHPAVLALQQLCSDTALKKSAQGWQCLRELLSSTFK